MLIRTDQPTEEPDHMTDEQIALIQDSWAQVEPIADTAARIFYERLFATAPEVRPLFTGDMTEQRRKLMAVLGMVVKALPKLDRIVHKVQALGRRHAAYGVRPEHYPLVGSALLWTLEQGLGESFTGAHAAAWGEAYGVLADVMLSASEEALAA
jgi:nitric oxide dioxygenase